MFVRKPGELERRGWGMSTGQEVWADGEIEFPFI